jgi:outer membrane protein assembly factor BamB
MDILDTLFVGLNGHVIAFNKRDGIQLWKTNLKSGFQVFDASFVTVLVEGERVYAHFYNHLFCLDASTGEQLWTNEVEGRGCDVAMLAVVGMSSPSLAALVEQKRKSAPDSGAGA